jgi:hypothetical protein
MAGIIDGSVAIATTGARWQRALAMAIRFVEIHSATDPEQLNTEWVVVENNGKLPFNTRGCGVTVSRKGQKKRSELGVIDPGFVLMPGDRMRMVTGNPGTKSHGEPPSEETIKNYFLFLPQVMLKGPGTILTLTLRGLPVTKVEFDPAQDTGVAAS